MTGESVPVEKTPDTLEGEDIPLGDRKNMAYSSGVVTFGHGRGIVVGTGMDTEIGKIANMLDNDSDTQTPMQVRLEKLGKVIGIAAIVICVLIFAIGLLNGRPVVSMLMVAISLAVGAIPEGLPAISTIILSMGVQRMVRHNAIIRKLPSVETLGCTTVICSDKTGTLTKNQMTVVDTYTASGNQDRLVTVSVLCCDAKVGKSDKGGGPYRNSSDRPGSRQGRCQERTGQRMSEGRRSRLRFIEEKDVHHQQDAGRHPADQYQRRAG